MVWDTQQSEVLILPRTLNVSPTLYEPPPPPPTLCPLFFSFLAVIHKVSSYSQISKEMRENCILPFLSFIFSKEEIGWVIGHCPVG